MDYYPESKWPPSTSNIANDSQQEEIKPVPPNAIATNVLPGSASPEGSYSETQQQEGSRKSAIPISAEIRKDDSVFGALIWGQEQTLQAVDMYNAHLEERSQHVHSVPEE